MNYNDEKLRSEPDFSSTDTVIMNTQELEEKLRQAREQAIQEMVERGGFVIPPDDGAEGFDTDDGGTADDVTVAEQTVRDDSIYRETAMDSMPVRSYERPQRIEAEREPGYEPEQDYGVSDRHKKAKKIIIICIAALLAVALILTAVILIKKSGSAGKYEESYRHAQEYYYDGEYDDALTELFKAIEIERSDECLLLMSQCYEAKGDYASAIEILEGSNSGSSVISKRLQQLRDAKEELESGKIVHIGDKDYPVDSTSLDLSGKKLTSDDLKDISKLTELTTLKLGRNKLDDISCLKGLSQLVSLDLSYNKISDTSPLVSLTSLKTLHLDSNSIEDFSPLARLSGLTTLTIAGMEISTTQLKALQTALPGCNIYTDKTKEDVVDVQLGGKTFKSDVTELDLSGCGISDISALSVCTKLQSLVLSGNSIKDLSPLADMADLIYLDVSDNSISSISLLMSMTKLEYLNVSGNSISSITALSELSLLQKLILNGNELKSFAALSELTALKTLELRDTGLEDSDLQSLYELKKLKTLNIEDNDGLTQAGVDALQKKLSSCSITHSNLGKITLGGRMYDTSSEKINASSLGITDISPCAKLTGIKSLDLSNNKISDISALSGLTTLEVLDLSYNKITDITPLLSLKNLNELYLNGNSLSAEQIDTLRSSLNCAIISAD